MMGLMGAQQPLDFTMPGDCQTVLDLRKVKETSSDFRPILKTEPNYQSPLQSTYYPNTTYINHRDSSEDGSERGSMSPPTSSVCPTIFSSIINPGIGRTGKPTRPFKAYPKDPLSLPVLSTTETLLGHASNEAYNEFRKKMLSQVQAVTNSSQSPKSKRSTSPQELQQPTSCGDSDGKDAAYWERRRKNNEAAKRSRDARRAKEDEIAIRAAFLEQENIQLKYENATLRNEAAKLRCLLYNR